MTVYAVCDGRMNGFAITVLGCAYIVMLMHDKKLLLRWLLADE